MADLGLPYLLQKSPSTTLASQMSMVTRLSHILTTSLQMDTKLATDISLHLRTCLLYTSILPDWSNTTTDKAVPLDIVLVLDQSGSMEYEFTTSSGTYTPMKSSGYSYSGLGNKEYYRCV